MTKVSLGRLEAATLNRKPFLWASIDSVFDLPKAADHLMATFPSALFTRVEADRPDKRYSMAGRRVGADEEGLNKEWREFLASLETNEYRRVLSNLTKTDLTKCAYAVTLLRYTNQDYLDPHTDKTEKIVTQIIYFSSRNWNKAHGGCLDILESSDPNSVFARILPGCGNSVVLVRSASSWHAVTALNRAAPERRAVQLVFHKPSLRYSNKIPLP